MNLKHLKTFLALSREKSFTKTADSLNCAQSGVTAQIKQLEEELGAPLFNRIGKTVSLTFEGERLIPYAQKMLSLNAQIHTLFQTSGRLTLGADKAIANYLLGDMIKEFSALYPGVEFFLKMADGEDAVQMLCGGELDAAIVLDLPVKQKSVKVLVRRAESILLAASPSHPLSGHTRILPQDFREYGLLLPEASCSYRMLFEQKLLSEGVRAQTALETDAVSIIKESSLTGVGIGLLPEFAVKKELIYHMLEKINYKTDYPIFSQLLIHKDKWISPDLEHFLEIAARHLL